MFSSQDQAALDAVSYYIKRSNRENKEYGGFIYKDKKSCAYSYTQGVSGKPNQMSVSTFNKPSDGNDIAAIYHTHPGKIYRDVTKFSTDDQLVAGPLGWKLDVYMGNLFETKSFNAYTGERTVK